MLVDVRALLAKVTDPQEPVGGKEPKSVRALPAQDEHLTSQCDKFELQ